ncbi:uncharacterized protein L201_003711 [Kwoniella dendrophila CBS 6074]|uniref:Pentatricopeptide repeat domain-containing protein n=1 Tax=Kwoniella dendrophila CBS 6074 TaxID=1295534 RepID=A0AAX4JW96_9TREE
MLSTTRQACARRLTSSFPPALPAESSRQAILRATAAAQAPIRHVRSDSRRNTRDSSNYTVGTTKKSRGISSGVTSNAALALAEDNRDYHPSSSRYNQEPWQDLGERGKQLLETRSSSKSRSSTTTSSVYPDEYDFEQEQSRRNQPLPEWLDSWLHTYDLSSLPPSPLPPLETFRGLIYSQPLLALLTITKLRQNDYRHIKHHELRSLMHGSNRVLKERPSLLNKLNLNEISKSLRVLRAILFSIPSGKNYTDQYKGNYLKGKILRHFLQLCSRLNQTTLYASVFQDRLREHINNEIRQNQSESENQNQSSFKNCPIVNFDGLALDLSFSYQWKLIIDLFNPESFPNRYFTSELISIYMQAHFGIHQSSKVPRMFELYSELNLIPNAESYNHLVQSYLEIGDLPTAREIVREASKSGISDYSTQQLSILRGYRALGYDLDLEKRVLNDIEKLGIPISARLLNALIRLRMEAKEYQAAKQLSRRFDLSNWDQALNEESVIDINQFPKSNYSDLIKPNLATAGLVFDLYSQTGDLDSIRKLWADMRAGKAGINGQTITTLIRALNGLDLLDEAVLIFESADRSEWALPPGVILDVQPMNLLIGALAEQRGLEGLKSGLALLHRHHVEPNDLTLKIVIDFVKRSIQYKPMDLAYLVDRIINMSNLKPTQSLLDSIIQSAVNEITRSKKLFNREIQASTLPNTNSPTGGLTLSPKFQKSLQGILDSLKSIDSKSGSRSLVNRLRYDAMTSTRISNLPSARIVWNSLIQRGYKPDQRHFIALMRGYSDAGLMYQAQDLLLLADQVGVQITKSMYLTLIVGWSKLQRPSNARKAYEKIKAFNNNNNNNKLDKIDDKRLELESVTAIIQAYSNSGYYSEAALLCYTDLKDLDIELDRKAINVTAQALRGSGDLRGCLEILEQYGPALDPISRKIVRGIQNYRRKSLGISIRSDNGVINNGKSNSGDSYKLIENDLNTDAQIQRFNLDKEILEKSENLLKQDDLARPIEFRRKLRLDRRLRRSLRRSILGENVIKEKNQEWINQRKIYSVLEEGGQVVRKGRILRRIVRSRKRSLPKNVNHHNLDLSKDQNENENQNQNHVQIQVKIGQVGEKAKIQRKDRRRSKMKAARQVKYSESRL